MELLRTPDERFASLPGYPFAPRYFTIDGGPRIHYLDQGPPDAEPVLMMHGEPSWSYLYRNVIPVVVAAGFRAVVPDLVGFGRSDKPAQRDDYTYARHVEWMGALVAGLDLHRVTLVGQDWGGLIGLRLVAEQEARFARVVAANTFLPTGDERVPEAFYAWQRFSQQAPKFQAGAVVRLACARPVSDEIVAAYDAPFPEERYLAGARQFPMLVPVRPDDPASEANRAARAALQRFNRPFLTLFSDKDPITFGGAAIFQAEVPGARGLNHSIVENAGHFLQEDAGEELGRRVVEFLGATPL